MIGRPMRPRVFGCYHCGYCQGSIQETIRGTRGGQEEERNEDTVGDEIDVEDERVS